ncbi:MAG TPA: transcription initiation factor IIB [Nitrososphaeraceae archaeon]|nr:transcription initiation factor IIB [Nitrososphaeraceae archaeon]
MQTVIQCEMCDPSESKMITDVESGEIICNRCGIVVVRDLEDTKKIWHKLEDNGSDTRNGNPSSLTLYDQGLTTKIGNTNRDASGNVINSMMMVRLNRMKNLDRRSQINKSARNLGRAFRQLDSLKDKLGLSNAVIEKTAYIYRKVQEAGLVRGRKVNTVLGASLYVACREFEIPRTLREISAVNNEKYRETSRVYRQIVLHLGKQVPRINLFRYVEKVGKKAKLDEKNIREALRLMKKVQETGLSAGKEPMGIVGAVIYLSLPKSDENIRQRIITQAIIADAAGVSEVTIRNVYKEIEKKLSLG